MRAKIFLASAVLLTLLALMYPMSASTSDDYSLDMNRRGQVPETHSVIVLSTETQSSMADALDAFYAQPADPGKVVVMQINAASGILIKNHEKVALIDPAGSIVGDAVQALQQLDILLITHEHTDHYSHSAVVSIQSKTGAIVVANPGTYGPLSASLPPEKVVKMRSGDTQALSGITVTAIASIHPSNEPLTYILAFSDFSVFHGSDSGFNPELNSYKGRAKLAIVPVGGASPDASPGDALSMVKALEPSDVIPMHGTKDECDRLGTLIAQQTPDVQYLRPQAMTSVVVNEFSEIGFVTILAFATCLFLALRIRRRVPT